MEGSCYSFGSGQSCGIYSTWFKVPKSAYLSCTAQHSTPDLDGNCVLIENNITSPNNTPADEVEPCEQSSSSATDALSDREDDDNGTAPTSVQSLAPPSAQPTQTVDLSRKLNKNVRVSSAVQSLTKDS